MDNNSGNGHGKEIGEIVRSALSSGDLSRLGDLGPAVAGAVQSAVKGIQTPAQGERRAGPAPAYPYGGQERRPQWQGPYGARGGQGAGLAFIVLGILGMAVFGVLGAFVAFAAGVAGTWVGGVLWPVAGLLGACFGACGVLTAAGFGRRALARRARDIAALFERRKVYTLEEMAAELGSEPRDIKKTVAKARRRGMLPDIYTDAEFTTVMRGEETYGLYLESEKTRTAREREQAERRQRLSDPATAAIEQFRAEGEETIRRIRTANDAIPGEEISEKLYRLEAGSARIVAYVEQHPEKLPDTRKFMGYYLPTALKLVEKYRQYEQLQVQPENVRAAKWEIERALDTVNAAFDNLMESLYQHDTLDVTTDIEVLEKMLEQEGLTGRHFSVDRPNS